MKTASTMFASKFSSALHRTLRSMIITALMIVFCGEFSHATTSSIIWIPSSDVRPYRSFHIDIDNYFSVLKKGPANGGVAFPTDLGIVVGILPSEFVQMEVGADLVEPQDEPWLFNAKIGIPENVVFPQSPAIAVGVWNLGLKKNVSDANVFYLIASKSMASAGRFHAGAFQGNKNILLDPGGNSAHQGFLFGYDRPLKEISDKLSIACDYQSGKSSFGAASVALTCTFTESVSLLGGYVVYNGTTPSTLTVQMDINL